jgi:hypothetical protein
LTNPRQSTVVAMMVLVVSYVMVVSVVVVVGVGVMVIGILMLNATW